jgi:hypothetical protein
MRGCGLGRLAHRAYGRCGQCLKLLGTKRERRAVRALLKAIGGISGSVARDLTTRGSAMFLKGGFREREVNSPPPWSEDAGPGATLGSDTRSDTRERYPEQDCTGVTLSVSATGWRCGRYEGRLGQDGAGG